jgi:hypothetical protein
MEMLQMRKLIQTTLGMILMLLSIVIAAHSQTTPTQSQTDSAPVSPATSPVRNGDDCEECNKRLDKTLDALEKSEAATKAVEIENAALRRASKVDINTIANLEFRLSEERKRNAELQKQVGRKICILTCLIFKIRY